MSKCPKRKQISSHSLKIFTVLFKLYAHFLNKSFTLGVHLINFVLFKLIQFILIHNRVFTANIFKSNVNRFSLAI